MKKAVLYCTCCGTLDPFLPPDALKAALEKRAAFAGSAFVASARLCRKEEADDALRDARAAGAEGLAVAACSLSARGREAAGHLAADPGGELPLEWADTREGCAWIHGQAPDAATAKATDLVCMSLSALDRRPDGGAGTSLPCRESPGGGDPCEGQNPPASPAPPVLVIGAGPAGLACAAALGGMGVRTILAERRAGPGGMLPQLGVLFPHFTPGKELLEDLSRDLAAGGATLRLETAVTGLRPLARGYGATLRPRSGREEELAVSAVVLATGAMPVLPRGYFRYGEMAGVSSQMELETQLAKVERGEEKAESLPRKAVFLQCVAAREDANPYCSAVCCPTALKNALRLRALLPGGSVTVVHRNIVTPGIHLEDMYRRATDAGVHLRSHDPLTAPEPRGNGKLEGLAFVDALDGRETFLPADRLVCSTPLKPPPGAKGLADGLGLRQDDMGFACGREPVLPLSSHLPGVYVCGAARWPVTAEQSMQQGRAVAARAAAYLRGLARGAAQSPARAASGPWGGFWPVREHLPAVMPAAEPAAVREDACSRCGRCIAACPYQACSLPEDGAMTVAADRCRQCGSCAAVCPAGAARLAGDSISALRARIKEALGGTPL